MKVRFRAGKRSKPSSPLGKTLRCHDQGHSTGCRKVILSLEIEKHVRGGGGKPFPTAVRRKTSEGKRHEGMGRSASA